MEELISKMSEFADLQSTMKAWCLQNSVEPPKILAYSLEKISKLYENFLDKYGSEQNFFAQDQNSTEPIWFENELTLFQWTVVAFSLINEIYLGDLKNQHLEQLSKIFRNKENYIIDYEIKCMTVKGKQIRNAWKVEEQKILSTIIQETVDKNKWNQIARQLYKTSQGKYFRQGKHCRQRWFSYIENRKPDKQWNLQTDIQLLELISAIGKRWSQIANKFTKTQTRLTLRKRFKTLLEEAYVKLGHHISEKQAVSFLLEQKYETASYEQNKGVGKKFKNHTLTPKTLNSANTMQKITEDKEIQVEENKVSNDSKDSKSKCQNYENQKISIMVESPMGMSSGEEMMKESNMGYPNGVQMNESSCNMSYVPINYFPQIYPMMSPISPEGLNFGMGMNSYPFCGQLIYYL